MRTSVRQGLGARRESCIRVHELEGPLSKFILGYVRDPYAVEDLVQETFLKAVRNLHRYRGQASLKTWIFSIARNVCLDHLRACGRSRLRLVEALDAPDREEPGLRRSDPPSLNLEPDGRVERNEMCARVTRALGRLSATDKQLLILRVYLGLGYREIARRCRVAPEGMGTRMARALEGLSKGLERSELSG